MLLARCLLLSSTVLQAQFLLYQMEPFQFVDIGDTAQIQCMSTETISSSIYYQWYKRRGNEILVLVKDCSIDTGTTKFVCRVEQKRLILEIVNVERDDSGIYLCAKIYSSFPFSSGSSLIVGDSYTRSTRVMLLLPPPPLVDAGPIACVVHGVSDLVQVSWEVPGGLQQEGLTQMMRNSSSLLSFVSVLQIPMDSQWSGKNFTCKVRFNASGPRVKETAIFPAPPSTDSEGKCLSYVPPILAAALLALLTLLLTLVWVRCCPSRLGVQLRVDEAPPSEVLEEGVCYAQLDLSSKSHKRNTERKQESSGGNL